MTIEDKAASPSEAGAGLASFALSAVRALLGVVLIGLVLLNVINAVARAIGEVVIGVDEVLVFGMIWMVMIGMMLVTADRSHIALEILTARVGPRAVNILSIITHAVMAASCGYAAVQSFGFVQRIVASGQTSMALGMPMVIPHSALLVGFAGTAVIAAMIVVSDVRQLSHSRGGRA
ncbi:TRAP transporter small permease [Pseudorhodoplanes sp.]|uniref:TRAP transporter small permease n=1 Tax=Pseudorhodoplanes sp. TaxID=1934341 RepID=UPI002CD94594|nr:TRAP transporter small permease [Pseudorhodoplanes sp.]HWV51533.1 TRAP transporter small permease [Pseudorhodoplanes sp.]